MASGGVPPIRERFSPPGDLERTTCSASPVVAPRLPQRYCDVLVTVLSVGKSFIASALVHASAPPTSRHAPSASYA